jgi:hypothetical protein
LPSICGFKSIKKALKIILLTVGIMRGKTINSMTKHTAEEGRHKTYIVLFKKTASCRVIIALPNRGK